MKTISTFTTCIDPRTTEAAEYRRWYKSARWKRIREQQLRQSPLCEWCIISELVEPATVVHHSTPHRGNEQAFFRGPFTSLCKSCHDKHGQREDLGQTVVHFSPDGWPV